MHNPFHKARLAKAYSLRSVAEQAGVSRRTAKLIDDGGFDSARVSDILRVATLLQVDLHSWLDDRYGRRFASAQAS